MLKRRFGRTGMETTVLTFGAMRIPAARDESDAANHERAMATLRRALEVGINHIETARGYGTSEELIGRALRDGVIRRDAFYLTTKIGPVQTADEFLAALEDSMGRMGVSYVDNLDIHGVNNAELLALALQPEGTLEGARRAIDRGLVGHLGFSTHAPLEVILAAIDTGEFESVNLHYYLFNPRNRPAVESAAARGMGVFIISPTDKGGQLFAPPPRLARLCAPYTPIELNQRWLLSQPEVHTLSLGVSSPEEFDAHLRMAERGEPLLPAEEEMVGRLSAALHALGETYCNFCHACLPCPEDVNIPEVLRLRNLALAYDMTGFGRYRYGVLARRDPDTGEKTGGIGHWLPGAQGDFCTDCGDCLPRCPLSLPIPALLRETHALLSGEGRQRLWED